MQVFKTFMKILKTRLTSALLYLVIFMVIAVIMADTAKDNNDYEDYKMSVSVIDRDNSAESKRLQDFIFSDNKKGWSLQMMKTRSSTPFIINVPTMFSI